MGTRKSSFIGMVIIVGFLIAAWSSHGRGGMLTAMVGLFVLAPAFLLLVGRFLRGDE